MTLLSKGTGNFNMMMVDSGTAGPNLTLIHLSTSPAVADTIAGVQYSGFDDGGMHQTEQRWDL